METETLRSHATKLQEENALLHKRLQDQSTPRDARPAPLDASSQACVLVMVLALASSNTPAAQLAPGMVSAASSFYGRPCC
jgi:hypothetical protein